MLPPGSSARRIALCFAGLVLVGAGSADATRGVPKNHGRIASCYLPPPARGGKIRLALFDADGTLRLSRSGRPTPSHRGDVVLLPGVAPRLAELARQGYLVAVLSNQAGVVDGYMTSANANKALRQTCKLVAKLGGTVHYYDFAPAYDKLRKPETGMADRLEREVARRLGRQIDWEGSFMVGDAGWKRGVETQPDGQPGTDFSNTDRVFAERLHGKHHAGDGMKFIHARDFFGWSALGVRNFDSIKTLQSFLAREQGPR